MKTEKGKEMQLDRNLARGYNITTQIELSDIAELRRLGFRSVLNARPDQEEIDQPSALVLEAAAEKAGLDYIHVPITPETVSTLSPRAAKLIIESLRPPVMAFCKTGARAAAIWSVAHAHEKSSDELIENAHRVGADIERLKPLLSQYAQEVEAQDR